MLKNGSLSLPVWFNGSFLQTNKDYKYTALSSYCDNNLGPSRSCFVEQGFFVSFSMISSTMSCLVVSLSSVCASSSGVTPLASARFFSADVFSPRSSARRAPFSPYFPMISSTMSALVVSLSSASSSCSVVTPQFAARFFRVARLPAMPCAGDRCVDGF